MLGFVLTVEEVEQLRRSHAMAPLSPAAVSELLAAAAQMAAERRQIARTLAELPTAVTELRGALNRLHRLVGG
jgi:hypothetical protein